LFASMLREKLQGKREFELADNLLNSLDNAESLLNMLIEITKLENKRIKPNLQSFKLDDLLSQLVSEFSLLAKQKSIQLRYVKSSLWVITDRRLLSRLIQNLLSNAVRYTIKGKVLIGVRRRGATCELFIADTGSGIAKENQAQIFDEFKRINPDDSHQGLGLGLTIVDKISQLLNFNLSLRSELNKGTVFSLSLDVTTAKRVSKVQLGNEQTIDTRAFLASKSVLILENDLAVQVALVTLFESWGARVVCAIDQNSAEQALSKSQSDFDLIIADYHLDAGDTGVGVACAIQQRLGHSVTTILSSADRSEHIQALAYENDMQYLPKPIKQAALKRLIQRLL